MTFILCEKAQDTTILHPSLDTLSMGGGGRGEVLPVLHLTRTTQRFSVVGGAALFL